MKALPPAVRQFALFLPQDPRIVLNNEHISLEVGWSPALNAAEAAQTNDLARRLPRLVGNV